MLFRSTLVPIGDFPEKLTVGISHGGLGTVLGIYPLIKEEIPSLDFCELAAFVDINGCHRISEWTACGHHSDAKIEKVKEQMYALWAYMEENRYPMLPHDGSVIEVTDYVCDLCRVIEILDKNLNGAAELLAAGEEFKKHRAEVDKKTLVSLVSYDNNCRIVVRRTDGEFVNGLYDYSIEGGKTGVANVVVSYNTDLRSVTLSLANPEKFPGKSCAEFMQKIYGSEVGGSAGIASTPHNSVVEEPKWPALITKILDYLIE